MGQTPLGQPKIQVVGVGLDGADSLNSKTLEIVRSATVLLGSQRHLDGFQKLEKSTASQAATGQGAKEWEVERWALGNFSEAFDKLRSYLIDHPNARIVVLASGDPLFFGIGRLLLEYFPAEQLAFHPQLSAIQLAFSRLKIPWQSATLVSVHGRGEALLIKALKRGDEKIAVLTDSVLTPSAIARLVEALELPIRYRIWVCENLGAKSERLSLYSSEQGVDYSCLNVVVMLRELESNSASIESLPLIGLPDSVFKGFPDRPTLMTKREIRLLILGAIAPLPHQVIWDIGAGTGSVSIELSRLCPAARIYALEKTAIGAALIKHNVKQLAIGPIQVVQAKAPDALSQLPTPDRVFIGGSSGRLTDILSYLHKHFQRNHTINSKNNSKNNSHHPVRIVLALATVENVAEVISWLDQEDTETAVKSTIERSKDSQKLTSKRIKHTWQHQLIQANISRSIPVGPLTRFLPLNPITIMTLSMGNYLEQTVERENKHRC
ncbi:precorrin-6y C5,15-methyltransferase, CbiE subunit domain protein [Synechococcus sp. PCC 7335]|nr:precorrin-6y C5,15-methyltransferase, CbiE subunit domain protein [Synechococcus sp. PCC 7335]